MKKIMVLTWSEISEAISEWCENNTVAIDDGYEIFTFLSDGSREKVKLVEDAVSIEWVENV